VLLNLLDNALRHTPAGGTVTACGARHRRRRDVTVTDNGPGIPAADLPHVFDRFYRGDRCAQPQRPAARGWGSPSPASWWKRTAAACG
jgi:two-component system sensor histidine kinase BaeS